MYNFHFCLFFNFEQAFGHDLHSKAKTTSSSQIVIHHKTDFIFLFLIWQYTIQNIPEERLEEMNREENSELKVCYCIILYKI